MYDVHLGPFLGVASGRCRWSPYQARTRQAAAKPPPPRDASRRLSALRRRAEPNTGWQKPFVQALTPKRPAALPLHFYADFSPSSPLNPIHNNKRRL